MVLELVVSVGRPMILPPGRAIACLGEFLVDGNQFRSQYLRLNHLRVTEKLEDVGDVLQTE